MDGTEKVEKQIGVADGYIARPGKIKDNPFPIFASPDASESSPEEATAPLTTATPYVSGHPGS